MHSVSWCYKNFSILKYQQTRKISEIKQYELKWNNLKQLHLTYFQSLDAFAAPVVSELKIFALICKKNDQPPIMHEWAISLHLSLKDLS